MLTPVKAIRAKCLDCCCDSQTEVRLCENTKCALHHYRIGHRPKNDSEDNGKPKRTISPEHLQAMMDGRKNNGK